MHFLRLTFLGPQALGREIPNFTEPRYTHHFKYKQKNFNNNELNYNFNWYVCCLSYECDNIQPQKGTKNEVS